MGTQSISVNVLKDGRENTAKSVSQKLGERRRDQLKKNRIQKDKEGKWGTGAYTCIYCFTFIYKIVFCC